MFRDVNTDGTSAKVTVSIANGKFAISGIILQAFEEGFQADVFRFTESYQIRPVTSEILRAAHTSDNLFYSLSGPFFHDRISRLITFVNTSPNWPALSRP
jgi:hypothetical protein